MEIECGEYVRIDKDFRIICIGIGKVVNKNQDTIYVKMSNNNLPISFNINSVTKHSKNIINLIEAGDYVNGLEVYKGKVASGKEKLLVRSYMINGMALEIVKIKTITTKEQIESIEYKVESEDKQYGE